MVEEKKETSVRIRFSAPLLIGLLAIGIGIGYLLAPRNPFGTGFFNTGTVPQPSRGDAAAIPAGTKHQITIKQNDHGWLPGGEYQLHLDDITGGQVLVSVTDRSERVIMGPFSVESGNSFTIPAGESAVLKVTVVRLKNMLAGGDFGEFEVSAAN